MTLVVSPCDKSFVSESRRRTDGRRRVERSRQRMKRCRSVTQTTLLEEKKKGHERWRHFEISNFKKRKTTSKTCPPPPLGI